MSEHVANIETILHRLREHNRKPKQSKCKFLNVETRYLGFIVNEKSYKPDPKSC